MPSWPKSNGSDKSTRVKPAKAPKPPKAQVVITMPRRKKEFGMGTFGTEPMDTVLPEPAPTSAEHERQPTPENDSPDQQQSGSNLAPDDNAQQPTLDPQATNGAASKINYDQNFGTDQEQMAEPTENEQQQQQQQPATPMPAKIKTTPSARPSFLTAVPVSSGMTSSAFQQTALTVAFEGHQLDIASSSPHPDFISKSTAVPDSTPYLDSSATPTTFETKRNRLRPEIPPAIVTTPNAPLASACTSSTAPQHLYSTSQTPSTPRTPVIFPHSNHYHAAAITAGSSYPTPGSSLAAAASMGTPKTPGSMSEWRMMQMQFQQQDDLPLSLAIPSVSAFSSVTATSRLLTGPSHSSLSANGLAPAPVTEPAPVFNSALSPACSCCCCTNPSPTSGGLVQSPNATKVTTLGNLASGQAQGQKQEKQHHSFLLHPSSPGHVTKAAAAAPTTPEETGNGNGNSVYQHHNNHSFLNQIQPPQPFYCHGNASSTSSDYFSSRDIHVQSMAQGHGLSHTQPGGSTATLASDYPPSSVDPSEFEYGFAGSNYSSRNSPSNGCLSATTGMESMLNQSLNYPYIQSPPASAVGGNRVRHCKNCPHQKRRPSLGATSSANGIRTCPVTSGATIIPGSGAFLAAVGGTDMEVTSSSASLARSIRPNSIRRASSPSSGSFKSLSSKLAANTIRKLSGSQKSLFSSSKDDLLNGCQCCQENGTQEDGADARGGSCCCCHFQGTGGGSAYGDSNSLTSANCGNKVQRMQSKLNSLRSSNGSQRTRKDKSNKSSRKSRDMEYNFSSQFVRQEFAQYNNERQIEDFQRAARMFKEQKVITTAAAAESIAEETRAATAEVAVTDKKKAPVHSTDRSKSSLVASLGITPIQETDEEGAVSLRERPLSPRKSLGSLTDNFYNPGLRVASAAHELDMGPIAFGDISMDDMSFSLKTPDKVRSHKGRLSNASQETRTSLPSPGFLGGGHVRGTNNSRTGRSVHSVCSVDTVSQQIAARHHQLSRLTNLSSVASIHSQANALNSTCESIGAGMQSRAGASAGGGCGGGVHAVSSNGIVLDNSPIQVVRATVGTVDDSSLPCFTFRMWVLSTVFVVMGAAISEYNFFRSNSAYFSIYFVQLASYFCGKAMAKCLPTREFEIWIPGWGRSESPVHETETMDDDDFDVGSDTGTFNGNGRRAASNLTGGSVCATDISRLTRSNIASSKGFRGDIGGAMQRRRWKFTLNPGKFNMKEHMLIGVAAAAGCSPAYATNVLAIQSLVFNSPLDSLTGIGLVVSSQCIGFSMAWFLFDYVIKPSVMIWPATLVNVSLYNTLHEHKVLTRWFTRMQLFWYAFFAVFLYQWLPRMFMPVLTSMALLCWIKPSSNILRKLGSGHTGLGIGCISLDWSIISGVGPLYTPWWAQANFFIGLIVMLWVVTPIVYFTNYWSAMSYPIVSSNLYDNNTQLYDISRIVNTDLTFNITMYKEYSPVIMTPYFAITYGTSFMAVVATFVHVVLYYGSDIWLISSTRFGRKTNRLRNSAWMVSLRKFFHGTTATTADSGPEYQTTTAEFAFERNTGDSSNRRNTDSMSFRADIMEGSAGIGGHGFEERPSFQQSSHYHPLSHQQYGYPQHVPHNPEASRGANKPIVDDRDQIPTDMFGTEDVHTVLMRAYPEIPGWWFGAMFVVCFAMAVLVCRASEIRLPVYALILALILAAVFALPMAIIQALSSSQIGLNVLSEVVCGYLLPGNQLGNSVFKCYSYMALYQCLNLTQGFKLGHYMKVPPRHIIIAVLYGTLVGAFVNIQVLNWVLIHNRKALFDADPRSGWSFRNLDLFFSASLLWGAISPTRLFGGESIYHFLPYCFLIGVVLPAPFYLMYRHFPPYGTMCKGNSPCPFLPKCACPAAQVPATTDGDTTTSENNRPSRMEAGRISRTSAFGHCWPFQRQRLGPEQSTMNLDDKCDRNAVGSSSTPNSDAPEPHLYYGNPQSAWHCRLRRVPWHLVNIPLVCVGASFVPQAPASFVVSAGIVAFFFAFLVLRYHHEWWRRYTFVLAAALDAGTQICNMAIFVVFSLILKGAVEFPSWFGNDSVNPEKCGVGDGYN
ncbi:hypothetical protein BG011_004683 [Mortierella polycephala]|uniref:Uncharacterized protein n=1 Tax=Mortierella polycephala TaxID=41804 RepID=A0A9P6QCC5_9FUNG|nr:hypothetical protein BG011_004683 [Mortierella polycephala]